MAMERDFKGIWIPKDIYLSKELSWIEKILLFEIDSLDTDTDHCYASNKYFAEFLDVTERRVQQCINKLKQLGYVEQTGFDGRKRTLQSKLSTKMRTELSTQSQKEDPDVKKITPLPRKKFRSSPDVSFTHNKLINNIINNNIYKTKNSKVVSDQFSIDELVGPDIQIYRDEVGTVVDDVQDWLIKTKLGKRVDKEFVCRQITKFAKRQGRLE